MFQFGTPLNNEDKMPRKIKVPKNPDRVRLSTCVGKLTAYVRVGNDELAKQWAEQLVNHLKKMNLLPSNPPGMG